MTGRNICPPVRPFVEPVLFSTLWFVGLPFWLSTVCATSDIGNKYGGTGLRHSLFRGRLLLRSPDPETQGMTSVKGHSVFTYFTTTHW